MIRGDRDGGWKGRLFPMRFGIRGQNRLFATARRGCAPARNIENEKRAIEIPIRAVQPLTNAPNASVACSSRRPTQPFLTVRNWGLA
jgi:hypothetical protein